MFSRRPNRDCESDRRPDGSPASPPLCVRAMRPTDMPAVLAIERESFGRPWPRERFARYLDPRNPAMYAVVACRDAACGPVVGFAAYEFRETTLSIDHLAVARLWRRRGVARAIVERLTGVLGMYQKEAVVVAVREHNQGGILAWRRMGFKGMGISIGHFEDGNGESEDAILLRRGREGHPGGIGK